jgi:hypothetical protein
MTQHLTPLEKPANIISFLKDGTACVIFFPYAPDLTEPEMKRIDAARRIRFFVYGGDAPVPPGASGIGTWEDYPVDSVKWAIDRSTYISPETLDCRQPRGTPQALVKALMNMAANACSDDHRSAVLAVTDLPFSGDNGALCRPTPSPPAAGNEAGR